MRRNFGVFLTPAGALLTAACFFLPWARGSCMLGSRAMSGAEIGGWLWLVPAAAAAIVAVFALGLRSGRLWRLRLAVHAAVLIALGVVARQGLLFLDHVRTAPRGVLFGNTDYGVEPGSIGVVAGLVLASLGAWRFWRKPRAGGADRADPGR